MKSLFRCIVSFSTLACLVACGGEDPLPGTPPENPSPSDTAVIDSVQPDTTQQDSAEEETITLICETQDKEYCELIVHCNLNPITYLFNGAKQTVQGNSDEPDFHVFMLKPETQNTFVAQWEGYQDQTIRPWARLQRFVDFDMQPSPTQGIKIREINAGTGPFSVTTDQSNQMETGVAARLTTPEGCIVEQGNERDEVSVVASLPALATLKDFEEGFFLQGSIASVSVNPAKAIFSKDAEVTMTLPMSTVGYDLKVTSANDENTVQAEGHNVKFTIPYGAEWTLAMDGRIIAIREEIKTLEKEQSVTIRQKRNSGYTYDIFSSYPMGFESDTVLNFMEERFLSSLFGTFFSTYSVVGVIKVSHPATVTYDVVQTIYHMTFEAGGREFQAKVYGKAYIEITKATIEE